MSKMNSTQHWAGQEKTNPLRPQGNDLEKLTDDSTTRLSSLSLEIGNFNIESSRVESCSCLAWVWSLESSREVPFSSTAHRFDVLRGVAAAKEQSICRGWQTRLVLDYLRT